MQIILLAIGQCQYLRDYTLVTTADEKDPQDDKDDQEEEGKREAEIQSDKPPHHE